MRKFIPIFIFSSVGIMKCMKMDKIYSIKYVDAHYSYEPDLYTKEYYTHKEDLRVESTAVSHLSAYGYIKKYGSDIIVAFIKKKGVSLTETIEKGEDIIKGLIIPSTALLSKVQTCNQDVLKGVKIGSRVAVTWRDVVYVANQPRYNCSSMYTEGTLYKTEGNHIVLKDTETIRTHPVPVMSHPAGKPLWYTIPISFISDMEVIS